MKKRTFWLWVAALTLLRLALAWGQQGYTWVGGAPLDDELMFRAAQSISRWEWLGPYDYLTLSKAMFYPLWLALLHLLHLPVLVGAAALWSGAALLAARAFQPMLKDNGRMLILYALLAFAPSSWASYTLRIYRDQIFPALCLLFFAGMCGALLRAVFYTRQQAALWPWLVAAGLGLAGGYLDREDAGLFLVPFAVLGSAAMLVVLARQKRWLCMAAQAIPYALLAAGVAVFCGMNGLFYGVFTLSDFSAGAFADAMGAMSRIATDSTDPLLSVPADARQKLYDAVPELQPLQYWLEEDPQLRNDFRDPVREDYRAGSFYWAIRRAAQFEGIYETPQSAETYWRTVADKVNAACEDGTLPARGGQRSGTTQPIRGSYVLPTLGETCKGLVHTLLFLDCKPYETARSIGTEEDMALWSGYLHEDFNAAAEAGKDTPYYSPRQKLLFGVMEVWRFLYALTMVVAFVCALVWFVQMLPAAFASGSRRRIVPWFLLLALLGAALLRCAMIAFVEVSSFGIGTATMYLATVHPLLILFTAVTHLQKEEL